MHSFQSEGDRLLVIEALHIAASHWNATARAVAEQGKGDTAAQFELRAIEALRLASEIGKGTGAAAARPVAPEEPA